MIRRSIPLKLAVYDVDRTLLLRTSAEALLIRYLRHKKLLPSRRLIIAVGKMIRHLNDGWLEATHYKSYYLRGIKVRTIHRCIQQLYHRDIKPRLILPLRQSMDILKQRGYRILIISGTLDCIVDLLVEELGADWGVGSRMETVSGCYTGRILPVHPYYRGKVKVLDTYLKGQDVDYAVSYAFGDSPADIPLLSRFGRPVAVNPGWMFRRRLKKYSWKTLTIGHRTDQTKIDVNAILDFE